MSHYILKFYCPDKVGIVAAVTGLIAKYQGSITSANQYGDTVTNLFFMRVEISKESLQKAKDVFYQEFQALAHAYQMEWSFTDSDVPKKVMILASKQGHCLADLLYRKYSNDLSFELLGVIANHLDHQELIEAFKSPFYYIPFEKANKHESFNKIEAILATQKPDVIVLARFMQILPADICKKYQGKIINIHHGFLPSFVGANSYAQAYMCGVKFVGATCHYVTEELDCGPIIEQDVIRISHKNSIQELVHLGKDIESTVLVRGLKSHLEDRVFIHANKTIILD